MLSCDEIKEIEAKVKENLEIPEVKHEPSLEIGEHDLGIPGLISNAEIDVDIINTPNDNSDSENEQTIVEIRDNITRKWEVLREEYMAERSVLPKLKADKKSENIIERGNKEIEKIQLSNPNFSLT